MEEKKTPEDAENRTAVDAPSVEPGVNAGHTEGGAAAAPSDAGSFQAAMDTAAGGAGAGSPGQGAIPIRPAIVQRENTATISVGAILSRAFEVLGASPLFFLGISLAITIPTTILSAMTGAAERLSFGVSILYSILSLAIQGAISFAVYKVLLSERFQPGEALNRGMSHLLPMFGAAIITGLGVVLGTVLLIIPGLVLMTMWAVVIPACVVEKLGANACISRSVELTKGNRWQVFGLVLVTYLAIFVLAIAGMWIGEAVSGSEFVGELAADVLAVPAVAYHSVVVAITYFDLRSQKEGVSVGKLANVFD